MVYLHYISCLRYTILAGNPRYMTSKGNIAISGNCLVGVVVKASALRMATWVQFPLSLWGFFLDYISDLTIGTPVATLPDAW